MALMYYLETGHPPARAERKVNGQTIPPWPLPGTDLEVTGFDRKRNFPLVGALLDIAIEEKQPAEIVRWYDHSGKTKDHLSWMYQKDDDDVAAAIREAYPEKAIAIWQRLAETEIGRTNPAAYEQAGDYLSELPRSKLRGIYLPEL
jgi:uncharacterized Zn finger protein